MYKIVHYNDLMFIFENFLLDKNVEYVDILYVKIYILQVNSLLVPGIIFRAFYFWAS